MTVRCVWTGVVSTDSVVVPWVLTAQTIKNASIILMATVESEAMIPPVLVSVCQGIAQTQTRSVSLDVRQTQSNCRRDVLSPNVIPAQWSAQTVNLHAQITGRA